MAGQMIVLPGVSAGGGKARVDMHAGDIAAAKIASLLHVMSPRTLKNLPGGGVEGKCRSTGKQLLPVGLGVAQLQVIDLAGKKGLTMAAAQTGGVAFPAGSATASYTRVFALALGGDALASNLTSNILGSYSGAGAQLAIEARLKSTGSSAPVGLAAGGNDLTVPQALIPVADLPAADTWAIYVVDYDNTSKQVRIFKNSITPVDTQTKVGAGGVDAASYTVYGYLTNSSGIRDNAIGDLYLFNKSLYSDALGQKQLTDLIAGMKSVYGI